MRSTVLSQVPARELLTGEFAAQGSSTKDTVRFYSRMGLLDPTQTRAGHRVYAVFTDADIERFRLIEQGKAMGFTLDEIRVLLEASLEGNLSKEQRRTVIAQKRTEIRAKLKALRSLERYLDSKLEPFNDERSCRRRRGASTAAADSGRPNQVRASSY